MTDEATRKNEDLKREGIKLRNYQTFSLYDTVSIVEDPSEKDAMKTLLDWRGLIRNETINAVSREEEIKLL